MALDSGSLSYKLLKDRQLKAVYCVFLWLPTGLLILETNNQ